jgi:hypothetical protein
MMFLLTKIEKLNTGMQKDGTDGANLKKNKTDKNKQRPYNII